MAENTNPTTVAYVVDTTQSVILWEGTKPAGKHDGNVKLKQGNITVDATTLRPLGGTIEVDMTSIDDFDQTGSLKQMLLEHLTGPDFFEKDLYPTSTLKLTSVGDSPDAQGNYTVHGDLTIKGQTHDIVFLASYRVDASTGEITVQTAPIKLDRTIWNITFGSKNIFKHLANFIIDDIFTVSAKVVLVKATD